MAPALRQGFYLPNSNIYNIAELVTISKMYAVNNVAFMRENNMKFQI
jgi:hypothetical protein